MAIGNIPTGSSGTFAAALNNNGSPIPLPAGSTWKWTSDDPSAVLTPSADTTSVEVAIPSGDTVTSITVTASTVAPSGQTVEGSTTVQVSPGDVFTVSVTQTA